VKLPELSEWSSDGLAYFSASILNIAKKVSFGSASSRANTIVAESPIFISDGPVSNKLGVYPGGHGPGNDHIGFHPGGISNGATTAAAAAAGFAT